MAKGEPLVTRLKNGVPRRISSRWRTVRRAAARRTPVRFTVRPDFVIIGAQKSGTSSLYWWLSAHPDVVPTRVKELHYFDRHIDTQPIGHYWGEFPMRPVMAAKQMLRRRNVVAGEATPSYLYFPPVPGRMHDVMPDVKLIAILRDPVERAISHHAMAIRNGYELLSFENALAAEPERLRPDLELLAAGETPTRSMLDAGYLHRGLYADQLDRWTALFDRSQLLLLRFDDLVTDPAGVYRRTLEFIGVDPDDAPLPTFRPYNTGSKPPTDPATIAWLREQFAEPNARLAADYGITFDAPA